MLNNVVSTALFMGYGMSMSLGVRTDIGEAFVEVGRHKEPLVNTPPSLSLSRD
jgi:hypothetical protein